MDVPVAIVTGGARGIGYALAVELLKKGYKVCIADYDVDEGGRALKELNKKFGSDKVFFVKCNVTSQSDLEAMFAAVKSQYGRLDVVCNNAGILLEDDWERTMDTNAKGVMRGTELAIKYMRKDNGGRGGIVMNAASIAGFQPTDELYAYCASKFAVVGYTRSLALNKEFADNGLKFVLLCPHITDTKMVDGLSTRLKEGLIAQCGFNKPEDVAKEAMQLLEEGVKSGAALTTVATGGTYFHDVDKI